MNIPQSTIEKPLTAIDYIVAMEQCATYRELMTYAKAIPLAIVTDERFARAFTNRLDNIRKP